MSQTVLTKENLSPVEPRRAPLRNADSEMNSQRTSNRRSLSGKFRNLFRKNSPSPNRSTTNTTTTERVQSSSTQQASQSPELVPVSTEAPHLRPPLVNWSFGKKKSKLTGSASEKVKKKETRKATKTSTPSAHISAPIHSEEHQTSIRGQNFVPRTPELTHGTAGRTQTSSITHETTTTTTTKGFRDYMVIDTNKSTQHESTPDIDMAIPPPYISDRSRSPSLNHQHLCDIITDHDHRRRNSSTPSTPDLEIIPNPKRIQINDDHSTYRATQVIVGNNPLLSSTTSQPTTSYTWKTTSDTSLNNTEVRSTTSSSMDVDVPKLHAPLISLGSSTHQKELKPTQSLSHPEESYYSLSTVSNIAQPNRSYTVTYGSLPDATTVHKENFIPIQSTTSNTSTNPGLSAIIEHHFRPTSLHFNKYPSPTTTSTKRTPRFDTSTTTFTDYDEKQHWPINGSTSSPISNHQHDGFIRPLTPPKPTVPPDVNTIHLHVDDLRDQISRSDSSDPPKMYRSSTIIYTKEKFSYPNGGELRTWHIPDNDENERYQKPSTSVHIQPSQYTNDYSYNSRNNYDDPDYEYESQRPQYYSDHTWNSNRSRSERDTIYDQSTRSYKLTEYTQEPLNPITPVENTEVVLRHYTLKRTKSYDGLGILISADVETRLNHRIRDVENDSPGFRAGLRKNDRIIAVNGINVEKTEFGDVLVLIKQELNNNNLQFSVINESVLL